MRTMNEEYNEEQHDYYASYLEDMADLEW